MGSEQDIGFSRGLVTYYWFCMARGSKFDFLVGSEHYFLGGSLGARSAFFNLPQYSKHIFGLSWKGSERLLVLDHKIRFSLWPMTWRFILGAVLRFPEGSEPTFSSLLVLDHEIDFLWGLLRGDSFWERF